MGVKMIGVVLENTYKIIFVKKIKVLVFEYGDGFIPFFFVFTHRDKTVGLLFFVNDIKNPEIHHILIILCPLVYDILGKPIIIGRYRSEILFRSSTDV